MLPVCVSCCLQLEEEERQRREAEEARLRAKEEEERREEEERQATMIKMKELVSCSSWAGYVLSRVVGKGSLSY